MKLTHYALIAALLLLTACGGSHRPVYSGHEESTEGVPGFVKGKKVSPYVKLGQSYTIDSETYVPRYEPDYVEEGMASWYGPGFHGGKTANGEEFNKHDMTAAHRTLPLPSIVRVTLISTGKQAYVRINDRGPFAHGRIIDLSRGAAEELGMIAKGTARVRVEYLPRESQRFTDLLAEGRDPTSIDIADEVIGQQPTMLANDFRALPGQGVSKATPSSGSWGERLNPISTAYAAKPPSVKTPPPDKAYQVPEATWTNDIETQESAELDGVSTTELAPPAGSTAGKPAAISAAKPKPAASPFGAMENSKQSTVTLAPSPTPIATPTASANVPAAAGTHQLQLGAFQQLTNAERLKLKVKSIGSAKIEQKVMPDGSIFYLVRMGPYSHVDESAGVLDQLNGLGINPKILSN